MRYAAPSGAVMRDLMFWVTSMLLLSGCWLFHRVSDETEEFDQGPGRRAPDGGAVPITNARDAGMAVETDPRCTTRRLSKGEKFEPVDMVWVVDSSRSMSDEQSRIQQTMNKFVSDAEARHFDLHLVMVTDRNIVPAPLGSDPERYRFVQRDVRSHEPLQALLDEWSRYADFLRPQAALHFVIVTDDDSDLPASEFKRGLEQRLERPYTVHAVASPDVGGQPCLSERPTQQCLEGGERARAICGAAAIGRAYLELAEQSGGEQISICIDDWREVFGPLLEAVTPVEIPCSIELRSARAPRPEQVELIREASAQRLETVPNAAACGPLRAFYIEVGEGTRTLTLCPAACGATNLVGAELHIRTDCQ